MSRISFLARNGFAPIIAKVTDIQQYLCDKGGGINLIRHDSSQPCDVQGGPKEKMKLECKVALITGGASGIGYAIANELLHEKLFRVIIGDLDPCKGMKSAHKLARIHGENKCCYIPLNVCCPKQLDEIMKKVKNNFGNLDILVNNAGVVTQDFDLEIDTNMRSIIHGTMMAFKLMKMQKNKGGVIINIGDVKGLGACKHFPVYAAEKSGVHKFSMGIGRESVPKNNVRVLALAPGLTDTDMGEIFKNKPDPPCMGQGACIVGRAVVHLAKYAESGELWVVEERKLYKANWPDKDSYLELKMGL